MNCFARLACMLVMVPYPLFSQVSVSGENRAAVFDKSVYGLGLAGGPASGVGISFRDHFPSKVSIQVIFGIIKDKVNTSMSAGAELQYDLIRGNTTRVYFGPGAGYFYTGSDKNAFEAPTRVGIGVGGEFQIRDALHLSVEGMFVYFSDGTILPLPQASIHYYFF